MQLEYDKLTMEIPPGTKIVRRVLVSRRNKSNGTTTIEARRVEWTHAYAGETLLGAAWAKLAAALDCGELAIEVDVAKYIVDRAHGGKIKKMEIKHDLSTLKHYGHPEDMEAL